MSLLDTDHTPVYAWLQAAEQGGLGEVRTQPPGVSSGSLGYGGGGPVWLDAYHSKRPPSPPELVNGYKSVAYACIRLNSNGLSKVPLRLYATTGPQEVRPRRAYRPVRETRALQYLHSLPHVRRSAQPQDAIDELVDHPLLAAFQNPNPYFDGQLLIQYLAISLDVIGVHYLYPERPSPKVAPTELWPLQSQYVFPVKGTDRQAIKEYQFFGTTFQPDELIRVRWISLRDPYLSGYAPLHACFEQSGLGDYYTAAVETILKGGPRPSYLLSPKDPLLRMGDDERKVLERDWTRKLTGAGQGRVVVTDGSYDATALDYKPTDLAGLELTKFQRLTVANCFDVPISMLQAEDSNKAVASEGTRQHQTLAIEPRCRLIAAALTKQLCWPLDRRLFLAFDNPVQSDRELDAKIIDMKIKSGEMTINEARLDDNQPEVEWGDEPWMANTLQQPSQQAVQFAQAQETHDATQSMMAAEAENMGKGGDGGKDQKDEQETAQRSALLREVRQLIHDVRRRDRRNRRRGGTPAQSAPERPGRSPREQHLRPAGWDADRDQPADVVRDAAPGDPGEPADRGLAPAADDPGERDGLHRPDGAGDDSAGVGLLGRGGPGDVDEAGSGPG